MSTSLWLSRQINTFKMVFEPNWLVQIPDRTDAEALRTRQDNVSAHVAHNKTHMDAGRIVMSGPLVSIHSNNASNSSVPTGSVMVWKIDNEAKLRAYLSEDLFVELGVWHLERAMIVLFLCAMRKAL